jgi:hypothetical protein
MSHILSWASKVNSLPFVNLISPNACRMYNSEEKSGYLKTQKLAMKCASEIAALIQEGWTENYTATLMETWLRDNGVKTFFHKPFVWWGDRTRFNGVKTYWDYLPSQRRIVENEIFILDVAPILEGYVADIGFSGCLGDHPGYDQGINFLSKLRHDLPILASSIQSKSNLWSTIDNLMKDAGYINIHATYPFGVLGHRLHKNVGSLEASFIHFGWQSYWELLSRGLFGQLLNKDFAGDLRGLWAIEPHIGGADFGLKFEEILVVEDERAYWLDDAPCFHQKRQNISGRVQCPH